MLVAGHTNDTAGHLTLELVFASHKAWVGATEGHWQAEALRGADGNICAHLTSWLAYDCTHDVLS